MSFTGHEEQPKRDRLRDEMKDRNFGGSNNKPASEFVQQLRRSASLTERYEAAQRTEDDDEVESVWGEILDYERQRWATYRTRMQAARDAA